MYTAPPAQTPPPPVQTPPPASSAPPRQSAQQKVKAERNLTQVTKPKQLFVPEPLPPTATRPRPQGADVFKSNPFEGPTRTPTPLSASQNPFLEMSKAGSLSLDGIRLMLGSI